MKSVTTMAMLLALAVSGAAHAQTVHGVPSSVGQAEGCFNFVVNGVAFALPMAGLGASDPRGGQATVDGWRDVVDTAYGAGKTVTVFPLGETISPEICKSAGEAVKVVQSP